MEGASSEVQSQMELVMESPRSVPNSPKSAADLNLSQHTKKRKIQKRFSKPSTEPKPTSTGTKSASTQSKPESKPTFKYDNIYLNDDTSLHKYAVLLKQNCEQLPKKNDDVCRDCHKGGDLLHCDGCPRSFHRGCVSEKEIPLQKWFCKYCQKSMKRVKTDTDPEAAEKVFGVGRMEQISKRCIRIVDNPKRSDIVACALCRSYYFSENGFNDQTVIVCDQCEKEYHVGCLREHKMADLKELPAGNWFCTVDCERLHSVLKNVVAGGPVEVPDSLTGIIKKKLKDSDADSLTNLDVKWIVLHGKDASDDRRMLLKEAVKIFHAEYGRLKTLSESIVHY